MINHDKPLWDGDGEESEEAFDLKYDEWEQRDWMTWSFRSKRDGIYCGLLAALGIN